MPEERITENEALKDELNALLGFSQEAIQRTVIFRVALSKIAYHLSPGGVLVQNEDTVETALMDLSAAFPDNNPEELRTWIREAMEVRLLRYTNQIRRDTLNEASIALQNSKPPLV